MSASITLRPEVILPPTVEDCCYLHHGERRMMARVFTPAGANSLFPKAGDDIEIRYFNKEREAFATFLYLTHDFLRDALAPV